MNQSKLTILIACMAGCFLGCTSGLESDPSVFRYNESANINSLDPAFARTLEPMWVVDQLFDGLVELDAGLQVKPCVAESFFSSDSGRTWTFVMRDGVRFSHSPEVSGLENGREVVAADVIYSLNRIRDPQWASAGQWILDPLDRNAPGAGMVALGRDTVRFYLRESFPPFLGLLATAYANIVPREAVEHFGEDFRRHPVGSGPFQLAWWMEDVACVLHKNPTYWERDEAGEALPYLDAVHIGFAADMGAEYQGLLQGRYDFMSGLHPAYMEELLDGNGGLRPRHAEKLRMEKTPFLKTDYVGIHVESDSEAWQPWLDVEVRRALSLAIDRQGIATSLRRGSVVPTTDFVPPALLGMTQPSAFERDLARAQAMLDSIRKVRPQPWSELVILTTSDYTDLCSALQFQWESLGLKVAVDVVSPSTHRERVANGKAQMFRKSWLADYPDAENFLSLFSQANFAPGGPNYTHYTSEEFESLMQEAINEPQETSRLAMYRKLNAMIARDLPVIPLFHDQVTHFLRKEIKGWEINAVNRLDLRRVHKGNEEYSNGTFGRDEDLGHNP